MLTKKLFKSKKGNWPDIFLWLAVAFFLSLFVIIIYYVSFRLNNSLVGIDAITSDTLLNDTLVPMINNQTAKYPVMFDIILPIMYAGFLIFSFIAARFIKSSHKFTPLTILMGTLIVVFSMVIEAAWQKLFETGVDLVVQAQNLILTNHIMNNMVLYALFYVVVVGFSLYAKDD